MVLAVCVKEPVNHWMGEGSQGGEDGCQEQAYFIGLERKGGGGGGGGGGGNESLLYWLLVATHLVKQALQFSEESSQQGANILLLCLHRGGAARSGGMAVPWDGTLGEVEGTGV